MEWWLANDWTAVVAITRKTKQNEKTYFYYSWDKGSGDCASGDKSGYKMT